MIRWLRWKSEKQGNRRVNKLITVRRPGMATGCVCVCVTVYKCVSKGVVQYNAPWGLISLWKSFFHDTNPIHLSKKVHVCECVHGCVLLCVFVLTVCVSRVPVKSLDTWENVSKPLTGTVCCCCMCIYVVVFGCVFFMSVCVCSEYVCMCVCFQFSWFNRSWDKADCSYWLCQQCGVPPSLEKVTVCVARCCVCAHCVRNCVPGNVINLFVQCVCVCVFVRGCLCL